MNTLLWVLQAILAIKFVSAAFTHGLRPDLTKMQRGEKRFGALMRPLLALISLCALAAAAGLVLPALAGSLGWLAPWSAALLAVMILAATGLHLACRENPNSVVSLVLFAMAAFVAYGRWVMAPL